MISLSFYPSSDHNELIPPARHGHLPHTSDAQPPRGSPLEGKPGWLHLIPASVLGGRLLLLRWGCGAVRIRRGEVASLPSDREPAAVGGGRRHLLVELRVGGRRRRLVGSTRSGAQRGVAVRRCCRCRHRRRASMLGDSDDGDDGDGGDDRPGLTNSSPDSATTGSSRLGRATSCKGK